MKLTEYDISNPYLATVVESERITDEATDEVRHIVLSISDATFHFVEGQSVGVLVPGPHEFGNPFHMRLYSIANSRSGEDSNIAEVSICVRRCFYIDEVSGERYPGLASNFLCDRRPGDTIQLTGPYGRQFMPPRDKTCNLLMIGVGTGIAPFRAFIKHVYEDRKEWKGKVRLFYGAKTGMDLLYLNDKNDDLSLYYDQETFKAFQALSPRPHVDEPEDIGAALEQHSEEVWELVKDPKTYIYVSGLSRLEERLDEVMSRFAGSRSAWKALKDKLIESGRWSTLFYE